MSRPRGFADLAGRRVGIWGFGVEGRAALARLGSVTCEVVVVDDRPDDEPDVLAADDGGLAALASCDVVLKAPGVPRRREDVIALEDNGVFVTSALNLWMLETDRSRVIAVTGTKGKSTTTALTAFMLRAVGEAAEAAGNIGRAPYEPGFPTDGWVVLEVSSFQAVDLEVTAPVVLVTSLGSDHLDWHGSIEQYRADKLHVTRVGDDHLTLVANTPALREHVDEIGGVVVFVDGDDFGVAAALGLLGAHNASNAALALHAVAAASGRSLDEVARAATDHAGRFEPLPGRLTLIREHDGVRYVDDGLATAPLPTIAALEVFSDDPVALIVGGYDRGVDYTGLAEALAHRRAPTTLVTMPDAGARIARTVTERVPLSVHEALDMDRAVALARVALGGHGVVLMSPAAPSFTNYANWRERSDDFARVVHAIK